MSIIICFWGVKRDQHVRLTTSPSSVSHLSRRYWILDIKQPYRTPWPVTRIVFFNRPEVGQLTFMCKNICTCRVSQEECARLREGVPYGKVYRYNSKHLCPKSNGYGDNGQRKVWSSGGSMHYSYQLTSVINVCPWVWCDVRSVP
jgi:hypothetical protein